MQRALEESATDAWINGRRRDHGAERASLPVWEGNKVNPLAFWSFEDCWNYLRKHKVCTSSDRNLTCICEMRLTCLCVYVYYVYIQVPYHPLHDVGFSSLGDMQSTAKVPLEKWMTYGGERSGRFQGLTNKDGSAKTECGKSVDEL